ncbi:GMC family oxidoreductase N-terminal domain-containing protein [Streptomyces griseochromogenes]|uniref:GMC family oxidoreductase N-terminal domain-containing protein n=1 Tax=Streptomyces griseochromogenes TaxID=68214 RepID=UPI000D19B2A3
MFFLLRLSASLRSRRLVRKQTLRTPCRAEKGVPHPLPGRVRYTQARRADDLVRAHDPREAGSVLGGSSSINGLVHLRGHRSSYDAWARTATGSRPRECRGPGRTWSPAGGRARPTPVCARYSPAPT